MSDVDVASHKAQLIAALKRLYRKGTITRPATPVPNNRGGYTTTPGTPTPIWLQRETEARILAPYNIKPDEALIFVLNTIAEPTEGDVLEAPLVGKFTVRDISLDPVTAVYHCRCHHA